MILTSKSGLSLNRRLNLAGLESESSIIWFIGPNCLSLIESLKGDHFLKLSAFVLVIIDRQKTSFHSLAGLLHSIDEQFKISNCLTFQYDNDFDSRGNGVLNV